MTDCPPKRQNFFETEVVLTDLVSVEGWSSSFLASGRSRLDSIGAGLGIGQACLRKLVQSLRIWALVLRFCSGAGRGPPNRRESSGRLPTCLALPFLGLLVWFYGSLQLLFRGQGVVNGGALAVVIITGVTRIGSSVDKQKSKSLFLEALTRGQG